MPYIHERKQFGQAIGEFQLVQARSPTCMSDECVQGLCLLRRQGCRPRRDHARGRGRRILYGRNATKMALDAVQLLGVQCYINDYPTDVICATPSSMNRAAPARSGAC